MWSLLNRGNDALRSLRLQNLIQYLDERITHAGCRDHGIAG